MVRDGREGQTNLMNLTVRKTGKMRCEITSFDAKLKFHLPC